MRNSAEYERTALLVNWDGNGRLVVIMRNGKQ
jgi:hypothetical protein